MRVWMKCWFALLVLCLSVSSGPAQQAPAGGGKNLVTVTVTGVGMSKDEAIRDGQRQAVQEAAGQLIYSASETRDFVLVRDTVLARSAGFVQSYEIIGKPQISLDDVWNVKMEVVVSRQGIVDTWGVVTNLLEQMGRPTIMVAIRERIDDQWQDVPTVQTRVEGSLVKSGFHVVNQDQIDAIDRKALQAAVAEDNPGKIQQLARKYKAQIFITGQANATTAGQRNIYGRLMHIYEAEANVRTFRADTAQIMSAIPGKSFRGAKDVARSAAKQALDSEGQYLAEKITQDVLRFWMDVMEGRGEVILRIESISYGNLRDLRKQLEGIEGVKRVDQRDYSNQIAELSLQADSPAQTIADRIDEKLGQHVRISDLKQNVIEATYKADDE